jgi:hypothetical protein
MINGIPQVPEDYLTEKGKSLLRLSVTDKLVFTETTWEKCQWLGKFIYCEDIREIPRIWLEILTLDGYISPALLMEQDVDYTIKEVRVKMGENPVEVWGEEF